MIKLPPNDLHDFLKICEKIKRKNCVRNKMDKFLDEKRRKSVDNMIFFAKHLNIKDSTYFSGIQYLDSIFEIAKLNVDLLDEEEILIISFICLYQTTNKYEEIDIEGKLESFPIFNHIINLDIFSKIQECMSVCIENNLKRNYFEKFAFLVLNYFDEYNTGEDFTLSKPFQKVFCACKFLYKMLLQNYNFYRRIDHLVLYFSIILFSLKNDFFIKELEINFKHFNTFYKLVEICKIDVNEVMKCAKSIKNEYLVFLKQNERNGNFLYELEYLSFF
jgi:hypothetical protein